MTELPINQIIQGDCLEILKTWPDRCVDLIVTDPPYGLDKKLSSGGGAHKFAKFRLGYAGQEWDKLVTDEYWEEIFRVSANQIVCGANYYSFPPTRCPICWDKKQMLPTFSRWEYIWTSFSRPSKLYEIRNGEDERCHPTQKPLDLMLALVSDFSTLNAIILDPFAGSGTTLVAAKQLGRKYIGIEIEPKYVAICKERLKQEQLPL